MYTNLEIKKANKLAYNYIFTDNYRVFNKVFKFDKRTRIGNLANKIVNEEKPLVNWNDLKAKREERKKRKFEFKSILKNPLVLDFVNNKKDLTLIENDRLQFSNWRNHWAKNDFDKKILTILKN